MDPAAAALSRVRASTGPARRLPGRRAEPRFSGPGPDRRDPQRLGGALDDWVSGSGHSDRLAVSALLQRWPQVVGDQVAAHVAVAEYRPADGGGTVILVADSAAWALQMRYMADRIKQLITDEIGTGLVADVEIRGPAAARSTGRLRVRHGRRSPRE